MVEEALTLNYSATEDYAMELTMSAISSLTYLILVLLSGYCTLHFCRDVIMRAGNSSNWRIPMAERHWLLFSSYTILVLIGFGTITDATIHSIFHWAPAMLANSLWSLLSAHASDEPYVDHADELIFLVFIRSVTCTISCL